MGLDTAIQDIKERGYSVVPDAVDAETISAALNRIHQIHEGTRAKTTSNVPFLNVGHNMVYNLQNKDMMFLKLIVSHPAIRTVAMALLNDQWYRQIPRESPNYILRSLLGRSGGSEAMPLHIDSFIPANGSFLWSIQAAVILEDQTEENGCTVVVPGSHLFDRYANQEALSDAKPLPTKAGDVAFWDSRLWHGSKANKSGKSRWSVIGTFGRWWMKQNYDIPRTLPENIYAELSDEEKGVLGYCSMSPKSEFDRIDIKTGYQFLKPKVADYFRDDDAQQESAATAQSA
jgi:ectoine hydroxylase-related dioxygenase (phytanoyl-CoA dioxygenase family)